MTPKWPIVTELAIHRATGVKIETKRHDSSHWLTMTFPGEHSSETRVSVFAYTPEMWDQLCALERGWRDAQLLPQPEDAPEEPDMPQYTLDEINRVGLPE